MLEVIRYVRYGVRGYGILASKSFYNRKQFYNTPLGNRMHLNSNSTGKMVLWFIVKQYGSSGDY